MNEPKNTIRTAARPGNGWGQDRRLEFVDFRLRWDGRINRSDITKHFGISVPQASLDIARYLELAPGNLGYDHSSRVYLATDGFKPLFPTSDPQRYLNGLLAQATGGVGFGESFVGWLPPVAAVPVPTRGLNGDVLAAVLQAIRDSLALSVEYQSMSRPKPTTRTLTPLAIAHDGFRWHVRAYCHIRNKFLDFVIARISKVTGTAPAGAKSDDDVEWHNILKLELGAHPGLSTEKRRALEFDYGMVKGRVVLECRQALFFYVLQHFGFTQAEVRSPEAQQIVLLNAKALKPYIDKALAGHSDSVTAVASTADSPPRN